MIISFHELFKIYPNNLIALSASRFVPHPPNFTSLIALSFYLPAFFGRKSIGVLVIAYALTDFIIGFHNTIYLPGCNSNRFNVALF